MTAELDAVLGKHLETSNAAIKLALAEVRKREKIVADFFQNPRMLPEGMDEMTVEYVLNTLAKMDTNNFSSSVGVGEREGRVYSALVARRHFHLAHGIGRSGEITECQPKAIGSSLLYKLTNSLVKHAIHLAGLHKRACTSCVVLPVATGMAISLCLSSLRRHLGHGEAVKRKHVLIIRCDQKSALKAISTAGFVPVVVQNKMNGTDIVTDLLTLEQTIMKLNPSSIIVDGIGKICGRYDIFHLVNNAYGIQSRRALQRISDAALSENRVDFVVQSTDKNFLVPVGGSVVFTARNAELLALLEKSYPGRASASPIIDLFITLLQMGEANWKRALDEREREYPQSRLILSERLQPKGITILSSKRNDISIALSIPNEYSDKHHFGSELFLRSISGVRFIDVRKGACKSVDGIQHVCYGAHIDNYPESYLTVAVALGTTKEDIVNFCNKLLSLL